MAYKNDIKSILRQYKRILCEAKKTGWEDARYVTEYVWNRNKSWATVFHQWNYFKDRSKSVVNNSWSGWLNSAVTDVNTGIHPLLNTQCMHFCYTVKHVNLFLFFAEWSFFLLQPATYIHKNFFLWSKIKLCILNTSHSLCLHVLWLYRISCALGAYIFTIICIICVHHGSWASENCGKSWY